MPSQTKICKVSGGSYDEAKANALLISRSQELLEMLQKIMLTYDKGTQTYLDCTKLIKKITEL